MDWGCNQLEEADAFNASAMPNCDGHIKPKRHRCALLDTLPEGPEGPVQAVVGRHHCAHHLRIPQRERGQQETRKRTRQLFRVSRSVPQPLSRCFFTPRALRARLCRGAASGSNKLSHVRQSWLRAVYTCTLPNVRRALIVSARRAISV